MSLPFIGNSLWISAEFSNFLNNVYIYLASTTALALYIAIIVLYVATHWKIFEKAGEKGWKSLIPIYNVFLSFKIVFGNGWLFLLLLVPFVNCIVLLLYPFKLAEKFGKGFGFGLGLFFIPFIFYPILAFSEAEYKVGK